ncbi:MAG: helix-turn-helix domain-containing protein [Chloroflexota bacterium]|nr:helix-turn-helix domain-containing protein [Chloroflexota bacterium]
MEKEYLTLAEVVERTDLHPDTLRRWLREGRIRGTLLGRRHGWRIPAGEVDRIMRGEATKPDSKQDGTEGHGE